MSIKLIPYLVMDGNAKEAIEFYQKVFDAEVLAMITFGQMPANPNFTMPEKVKDRISHANLKIGDSELMFSDTFPGNPHQIGNQVTICISLKDIEKAHQIFDSLQQDGKVSMPIQDTGFSPAYGVVTDKFGVTFQINTEDQG